MEQHDADGQSHLDAFLDSNPEATKSTEGEKDVISHPWGSAALKINVERGDTELIEALNVLRLPPRFSAIWHRDQNALEIIYGPISTASEEIYRAFSFQFSGRTYQCEFRGASERLISLAKAVRIEPEAGVEDDRNLQFLKTYLRFRDSEEPLFFDELMPISFWINGMEDWDENEAVALARHLNFYMRYFDKESPMIKIHENLPAQTGKEKSERYPYSEFPEMISARALDPFLLGLWESTIQGGPRLRFLYSYQILEYAAFYHASDSVQHAVRRAVMSPHTHLDPANAVTQILDAIAAENQHETEKMKSVVRQSVDPRTVWREDRKSNV